MQEFAPVSAMTPSVAELSNQNNLGKTSLTPGKPMVRMVHFRWMTWSPWARLFVTEDGPISVFVQIGAAIPRYRKSQRSTGDGGRDMSIVEPAR